jgi:hypothetical protein
MRTTRKISGAIAVFILAGLAHGQSLRTAYSVNHRVGYAPTNADTVLVRAFTFRHARIGSGGVIDEDHDPPMQDPGFDPLGREIFFSNTSPAWNTGLVSPVPVIYADFVIPETGSNGTPACTIAGVGQSEARACTVVDIDPFGPLPMPGVRIEGDIACYGYTDLVAPGTNAAVGYAFSHAMLSVRGGRDLGNGTILWDPTVHVEGIGGGVSSLVVGSFVRDPIVFKATNLVTGDVTEHTLLNIDLSHGGVGVVDWTPGRLSIDAPTCLLDIDIPQSVVAPGQAGTLAIEVRGGAVTSASGSGIYAGSIPPIGASIPFDVPMPPITLDYDLGLDPALPWDVQMLVSGGGEADGELGDGCPADLVEPFGVLDLSRRQRLRPRVRRDDARSLI